MNTASTSDTWTLLFGAWLIAFASSLAVLFIGEVMGQAPCNLCWFQRACMFPLAIVLAVACLRQDAGAWRYALPLAAAGWAISLFHILIYAGAIPQSIQPCGQGPSCSSADMTILSVPLPLLSVLAFSGIAALLLIVRRKTRA